MACHFPPKPGLVRLHPSLPSSLAKTDTRQLKVNPVSPPRNFPTALSTSRSYPTRENTRSKLLPGTFYPQSRYLAPCPTLAGHQYRPRSLFVSLVRNRKGLFSVLRWIRLFLTGASPSFCTRSCRLGFATKTLFSPLLYLWLLLSPLVSLACSSPTVEQHHGR